MATEVQQYGSSPPLPPDEHYWQALLQEGETTSDGGSPRPKDPLWESLDLDAGASQMAQQNAQAGSQADWEQVQQVFDTDTTVELRVVGHNRGGLLVEWNSLRGFIPASQLVDFPAMIDNRNRREALADRIGQTLRLRVIELDRVQNRLILSERAAQVQPGTRANVLHTIREGDTCSGQVTNLCDFGVFVDLGGLEGLIHISELSWGRVGHPRDILSRGDTIQVHVMHVDQEQGRVALSLKRLHPDPWQTVEQRYQIGQTVEGVITNVVDFGAFACVEEGLEGLIHVSELAEGHFLHPRNVVHEGDRVKARILNIDGQARRLGLSLRR
jgi:small subunit ribosomal protein S1